MMVARIVATGKEHERLRAALIEAMRKTAADMPAEEILAVVSAFVGQLIAMQDQRRFTPAAVMQLVQNNIELGNRQAIDKLINEAGGHA
ncbi:hypothetical protein [Mesorhizobium sp.]|uniref:hypothetical protein n=1 Tax=Mesorhizobium sp. TaxID=1871066 RepID=UPI00120C7746|nr:hypothetical protein [Mesorhizobium sp.]TIL36206.1 MAG: hypothetical protein E5Y85_00840 [Mesorhizobium sp.]